MTGVVPRSSATQPASALRGRRLAVVGALVVVALVVVWAVVYRERSRSGVLTNGPLGDSALAGSELVGDRLAPGRAITFSVGNVGGFRHPVTIESAHLVDNHGVIVQSMDVVYEGLEGIGNVAYPLSDQQVSDYERQGAQWSARRPLVGATLRPPAAGMNYEIVLILRMRPVSHAGFQGLEIRYRSAGHEYRLTTAIFGRLQRTSG
jgi:hypothetical protein